MPDTFLPPTSARESGGAPHQASRRGGWRRNVDPYAPRPASSSQDSFGLVARAWDYPWSSAAAHALGQANPLRDDNPEFRALAEEPERRQRGGREFREGTDASPLFRRYGSIAGKSIPPLSVSLIA
jgi:hypothetical protein